MSVSVSGTKTFSVAIAPHLPAATMTTLFSKAPEQLTVGQLKQIQDALARVKSGGDDAVIGTLLADY